MLNEDHGSWFLNGVEMHVHAKTSDSIFLTEWSSGAHRLGIIPYYWTGKELKQAPAVIFDGEYFTVQDVTGDSWPELILLTQVETPGLGMAGWPFYAVAYAWRGDHFEYIGQTPAEKLKAALQKGSALTAV